GTEEGTCPGGIEADVRGADQAGFRDGGDGYGGRVESVPGGDEVAEVRAADRFGAGGVEGAGVGRRGEFEDRGGEVGPVDGAPVLVREQDAGYGSGDEVEAQSDVAGVRIAHDQRGAGDGGGRVDEAHDGFRGGLGRTVRGGGCGYVVVAVRLWASTVDS